MRYSLCRRGVTAGQQDRQLVCLESLGRRRARLRPEGKASLGQAFLTQPESLSVIDQDLDRRGPAVTKHGVISASLKNLQAAEKNLAAQAAGATGT